MVRLWLIINGSIKFSVKQTFTYYNWVSVAATLPSVSDLTFYSNNELTINGSAPFFNSDDLSCIYIGNLNGVQVVPALYLSASQITCHLTPLTFENN